MIRKVKLGIDVFMESHVQELKGKRIGLLTNQTGANAELVSTIRLFHEHPQIQLTALYAPEHGLKTNTKEGERFSDTVHSMTGVPVFSLYGKSKKPTDAMLEPVDVIVFDMQDIGSRYYTYIYTMAYMMEACARTGKRMYILDRPNPIGGHIVEGNLVDANFTSFVGMYPIPNRHGMTVGELSLYFNEVFAIHCDLTVIQMVGWNRNSFFHETGLPWIPPSPNTTSLDMMLLYPGTCLIEGTNLSEGRGTTQPFEIVGAPFIQGEQLQDKANSMGLGNVRARAISFTPTYQKFAGEPCEGIQLHITDRQSFQPIQTFVRILAVIAKLYPKELKFLEYGSLKHPMFDLLAGNAQLRNELVVGEIEEYLEQCNLDTGDFIKMRQPYLLYR
ncbi:exo-beta-N-acetylmuramidase NamZ domain-containing protein [Psychrobacillus sp. BM2]|uniref:exo-beta-N-acetylmuramidase NamZ family protein n=1 Tax=Psychrobacillus sp. BM2 TaxID=3400421 RepID=UPI003B02667E